MTRDQRGAFASRPADPEKWIRKAGSAQKRQLEAFTARLTIDVTPALRGRIKVVAFSRGVTVADMLRELLIKEFPETDGGEP